MIGKALSFSVFESKERTSTHGDKKQLSIFPRFIGFISVTLGFSKVKETKNDYFVEIDKEV